MRWLKTTFTRITSDVYDELDGNKIESIRIKFSKRQRIAEDQEVLNEEVSWKYGGTKYESTCPNLFFSLHKESRKFILFAKKLHLIVSVTSNTSKTKCKTAIQQNITDKIGIQWWRASSNGGIADV